MANTKQLPPDVLEVVAQQVGARLGTFPNHPNFFAAAAEDYPPNVDLGESFEVWTLPVDAMSEVAEGADLSDVARPSGSWHHQIRSDEQARSFARSKPLGATPDSWSLRELFVSPLAEDMSVAIDWIEGNVPDGVEVRYLSLPPFQVDAFWLVADPEGPQSEWDNKVVIIMSGLSSPLKRLDVIGSRDFLEIIRKGDRGHGFRRSR